LEPAFGSILHKMPPRAPLLDIEVTQLPCDVVELAQRRWPEHPDGAVGYCLFDSSMPDCVVELVDFRHNPSEVHRAPVARQPEAKKLHRPVFTATFAAVNTRL
jgi:hypothetical protein